MMVRGEPLVSRRRVRLVRRKEEAEPGQSQTTYVHVQCKSRVGVALTDVTASWRPLLRHYLKSNKNII